MRGNVITDRVAIPDDKTLFNILRLCFTVGTCGPSASKLSKDPAVVEWVASWRALNDDHPSINKEGMCNIITHAATQYNTAVGNYLQSGLRDLYVRTLKALRCDFHHDVALRVLATHVAKRPNNFSFALNDKDAYRAGITKRDPSVEAAIRQRVDAEVDLMGPLASYNEAFRFLHRLRARLQQDYASRRLVDSEAYPPKHFSVAPLTAMKPCFVRIDGTSLGLLYKAYFSEITYETIDLVEPLGIGDVLSVRPRNGFAVGKSFLTDGTQVLTTYVKRWEQEDYLTEKRRDAITVKRQKRAARLAVHEEQQGRRQRGEPAEGNPVHWKSLLPSVITATTHVRPQWGSFHASDNGFFGREAAHATSKAGGRLPTVFGLDPGVKNEPRGERTL